MKQNDSNLTWLKLDNAAKIYPAAKRRTWTALFRFSAELREPVDPELLQKALDSTIRRFPCFAVRLRRGAFWFYLDRSGERAMVQPDVANPCVPMNLKGRLMFRVRYYHTRIAAEFFHVLTDGTGGLTFLETLVAEYLRLRYGADIPRGGRILNCTVPAGPEELEDSFLRYAGRETRSRSEAAAYHIKGVDEPPDVIHVVTGMLDTAAVRAKAKTLGVTITEYITAALIYSIDALQRQKVRKRGKLKPVKICVPVNLRRFFPSTTLRNFALYVNPGIDARLGKFTFEEIAQIVHHQMALETTAKNLRARFSENVQSERSLPLRLAPLFLKNLAMRLVFNLVGDRITSTCFSNLGLVTLPPEMGQYVTRMDMMLGPMAQNRTICAGISYNNRLHLTFTSTIRETDLQRIFFTTLVKQGLHVKIESNESN